VPRAGHPADFDSATVMAAASARFLDGRGFPVLGKAYGEVAYRLGLRVVRVWTFSRQRTLTCAVSWTNGTRTGRTAGGPQEPRSRKRMRQAI
jgi:hypothetical protein